MSTLNFFHVWFAWTVLRFFFFSSRRRHTRSYGDWSSDVCSSDLLSAHARFFPPNPRCGPRHSPALPARHRQYEPARQARRCCYFESETGPAFRRLELPRPPWKELQRAAAARIVIAPPRLALPAPAPQIQASSLPSKWFARRPPRSPSTQCSALAAPLVRIVQNRLRGSSAQSSPPHLRLTVRPRPS